MSIFFSSSSPPPWADLPKPAGFPPPLLLKEVTNFFLFKVPFNRGRVKRPSLLFTARSSVGAFPFDASRGERSVSI